MAGLTNYAALMPRAFSAVPQMVAANMIAQFGSLDNSDALGFSGNVPHGSYQKSLVSETRKFAEFVLCPGKHIDDVGLR
uniref:Uncharacterized protein n=2 Tax=Rhizobium rhizogenes TaxID=359 RepID=A0A7S5DQB5_RHIRH|nr:hypothetical protein pC5.8b_253 [Rhizobium rhizogenes]